MSKVVQKSIGLEPKFWARLDAMYISPDGEFKTYSQLFKFLLETWFTGGKSSIKALHNGLSDHPIIAHMREIQYSDLPKPKEELIGSRPFEKLPKQPYYFMYLLKSKHYVLLVNKDEYIRLRPNTDAYKYIYECALCEIPHEYYIKNILFLKPDQDIIILN